MSWNPSKPLILGSHPPDLQLAGVTLRGQSEVEYLGISLSRHGPTDTRMIERISAAIGTFSAIRRVTTGTRIPLEKRRLIVQQHVRSLYDYVTYLQPVTEKTLAKSNQLDCITHSWILQVNVLPRHVCKTRLLCGLPALPYRRLRHMVSAIIRHHSRAHGDIPSSRELQVWSILRNVAPIKAILAKMDGSSSETLDRTGRALLRQAQEQAVALNKGVRHIPVKRVNQLPPIYMEETVSAAALQTATVWYLNKLDPRGLPEEVRGCIRLLHDALTAHKLGPSQSSNLVQNLERIALAQSRRSDT